MHMQVATTCMHVHLVRITRSSACERWEPAGLRPGAHRSSRTHQEGVNLNGVNLNETSVEMPVSDLPDAAQPNAGGPARVRGKSRRELISSSSAQRMRASCMDAGAVQAAQEALLPL